MGEYAGYSRFSLASSGDVACEGSSKSPRSPHWRLSVQSGFGAESETPFRSLPSPCFMGESHGEVNDETQKSLPEV